jgi:hypothetical protein
MQPCGKAMMQTVPTRYSCKQVPARCGQTSIYGDRLMCQDCEGKVPNPPAWECEDAGDDDFLPWNTSGY